MSIRKNERRRARRWISLVLGLGTFVGLAAIGGCTSHRTALCESGLVCPPGTACAADQDICIRGSCGNGVVDAGEICDDGNVRDGDHCSATCSSTEDCGNGVLDPGEICDDSNTVAGDGCAANCASDEACGNGNIDPLEVCDDSNNKDGDGCSASCLSDETCGNGATDRINGEVCDDGNRKNDDDCSNDCTSTLDCGNNIPDLDNGEECDDGNEDNTDKCIISPELLCKSAKCGDGWVQKGVEECDGNGKGKPGETKSCNLDCTESECGDGILNETDKEICDDGLKNGSYNNCSSNCRAMAPFCGDGTRNGPEVCDPTDTGLIQPDSAGLTVACNADCSGYPAYCGDGDQSIGLENCDEGDLNGVYNGQCNSTCSGRPAFCGDGTVHDGGSSPGHGEQHGEHCDFGTAGNNSSYNGCTAQCTLAKRCGDSALQANDGETCEFNADAFRPRSGRGDCRSTSCTYCGDGVIQAPTSLPLDERETCEFDENGTAKNDVWGCRKWSCTFCGDGTKQPQFEACDKGVANSDSAPGACKKDCSGTVPIAN